MQATRLLNQAVERAVTRNGRHGDNVTAAVALPVADKNPIAAVARNATRSSPSRGAPCFFRALRYGNHLTVFTSANQLPAKLFLIDSGASLNLIDEDVAREAAPKTAAIATSA